MRWATCAVMALSIGMSAVALAWSARREFGFGLTSRSRSVREPTFQARSPTPSPAPPPVDDAPPATATATGELQGLVEAMPQNVFHVSPYNDWPLFEIRVREGQRLKFRRVNGKWEGDNNSLTVQFETPAEIDTRHEDVEIATLELQSAKLAEQVLEVDLQKGIDAAVIRETNARQDFDRLDKLQSRTAASEQESQRARNLLNLAVVQREQLALVKDKKVAQARLQTQLAEHRLRRAQSEYQLADFKRELSWGNVPRRASDFTEVVVTKVSAVIGDVPSRVGQPKVWVEVIDDRVLQVRVHLPLAAIETLRVGQAATVVQEGRKYPAEVSAINIVADETTHRVPVLLKVPNHDRMLKINTLARVDF